MGNEIMERPLEATASSSSALREGEVVAEGELPKWTEGTRNLIKDILNRPCEILVGGTSGFSVAQEKEYRKKGITALGIGGRNAQKLADIYDDDFVAGSLFNTEMDSQSHTLNGNSSMPESEARRIFMEVLPQSKMGGVVFLNAAVEPDETRAVRSKETGEIIQDVDLLSKILGPNLKVTKEYSESYYLDTDAMNPISGKDWDPALAANSSLKLNDSDNIDRREKRSKLREQLVDNQIDFHRDVLDALLEGEDKNEPLTVVLASSVISKFKPGTEYERLKTVMLDLYYEYAPRLREKNVWIKVVMPGMTDTDMVERRGTYNGMQTGKYVDDGGIFKGMAGDPILNGALSSAQKVGKFLVDFTSVDPQTTPDIVSCYNDEQLDSKKTLEDYSQQEKYFIQGMKDSGILEETRVDKLFSFMRISGRKIDMQKLITVGEKEKEYLLNLRRVELEKYLVNYVVLFEEKADEYIEGLRQSRIKKGQGTNEEGLATKRVSYLAKIQKRFMDQNMKEGLDIIALLEGRELSVYDFLVQCYRLYNNQP